MKIVFLVINYMPHQITSIKAVIKAVDAKVYAFTHKNDTDNPQGVAGLELCKFKNKHDLLQQIMEINPSMVVVAGWAVKDFVWVAKRLRSLLAIPVVSYSDTQWLGNFRQRVNTFISPWHLRRAFTHLWVAGYYQYEYARKLGFKRENIIYNALSCDMELFSSASPPFCLGAKQLLFVGRFVPVKGLDKLVEAWSSIEQKNGWRLKLVGEGPLMADLGGVDDIEITGYLDQKLLVEEMSRSSAFILPSNFEPWALVLHEAAAAGLPIIATRCCGAAPHFVVNNFNGYQVDDSVAGLKKGIEKLISHEPSMLKKYSENSRVLACSITPEKGAAQLLSIMEV